MSLIKDVSMLVGAPARAFSALLVQERLLSQADVRIAELQASREHTELADVIVALGLATEEVSYGCLSRALKLTLVVPAEAEHNAHAVRLVPERLARRYSAVPLHVDNRVLTFATCRPSDPEVEPDLAFASGRRTRMVLATRSSILEALDRLYPPQRELDLLVDRLRAVPLDAAPLPRTQPATPASSVIELCDGLITRGVDAGASDIHIECGSAGTIVRYRICGVLETVLTLPGSVSQSVRNRFKIMAGADISVRHKPQDGAFHLNVGEYTADVRFSSQPSLDGEKLVMRVIDSRSAQKTLDTMGYDDDTLGRLKRALARPDGLVLVTGPTGSGKTTTLYAALAHLSTGGTNIVSLEDPVERRVPGVTQVPVSTKSGNTFEAALRSLLRQDPNVIMVGEVRDGQVAQILGQAAYTGHLVLSSMHTSDAATAITRLTNLGLEAYKVAESIAGVLAQRLVRTLCPRCLRTHSEDDAKRLGAENNIPSVPVSAGIGCDHCKFTGYLGRRAVAELLTPSDTLREAIGRGATAHEIRAAMRASGVATMRDQALRLVSLGMTSIEEVNRVVAIDGEAGGPRNARRRVLIADDEPITRMLVKLLLERQHFEVLEAVNGRDALEIALREHPDLLMTDLNMPEMDGYEAITRIRREMSLAMLPVLVLTSEEGPGVERRVLELGADDYVVKPFDPDVLLSRVNAVFRRLKVMAA